MSKKTKVKKNKIKTHKGTAKRFWRTGSGKLKRRQATQDHFNSRESSDHKRAKRSDVSVAKQNDAVVSKLIPYV